MSPRFLMDVNVARLGKWLRVLGYDAALVPDLGDDEILRIAREQGRIVVTKDRHLLERRAVSRGQVPALLVTADDFREQLHQVMGALDLAAQEGFTRCIECNEALLAVAKDQVRDRVPAFVYETQEQFHICPACAKVYWRGTHWRNMKAELDSVMRVG